MFIHKERVEREIFIIHNRKSVDRQIRNINKDENMHIIWKNYGKSQKKDLESKVRRNHTGKS